VVVMAGTCPVSQKPSHTTDRAGLLFVPGQWQQGVVQRQRLRGLPGHG
jgi:hypothetical protein